MTIRKLAERHQLTDVQLKRQIGKDDISILAQHFDKVELYPGLMKLSIADEETVLRNLNDTRTAMSKCLSFWKQHDPFEATYEALLEIVLKLNAGETADEVCQYLAKPKKDGKVRVYSIACTSLYMQFTV